MRRALAIFAALLLAGCGSLVPKKVEFFQDTVQRFPEQSEKLRELERQAIYRAVEKNTQTVLAAVSEGASTNVVKPAQEARVLTEAVAVSVGPPASPAPAHVSSEKLAAKLETQVAKFNDKVEDFKKASNENIGKKIEGTGLIQVSYFYWVGGIAVVLLLVFVAVKIALSVLALANPGAAIGLNVVNAAQSVLSKGFAQVVKGGEEFKGWVDKEVQDAEIKKKILVAFQTSQVRAQDSDVQNVVAALTK
jgi:hypothetical protein